ncbi:unnamed protein product [Strongylus vulgaris]|uniref:Endonuclease/exonuclease/phosphatase domain-containing protein n=1 Tax=Strongylus vulgaris TaxID=40348 RepID=A0A3P7IJI9_STRVU|nr:unnamed protein product [Strongylus vulgaris]
MDLEENSFHKFVVGDFNAKIGMPEEVEHRIGRFGSGLRNENDNLLVGLLSAERLSHTNSLLGRTPAVDMGVTQRTTLAERSEGGACYPSQWYHSSAVVRIIASFEQKCDSAESWKRRFVTV